MEKSSFVSLPSDLSKSVSLYAKEVHTGGKGIVKFCTAKITWVCVTTFNVAAFPLTIIYNIITSLPVASYHLYKNNHHKLLPYLRGLLASLLTFPVGKKSLEKTQMISCLTAYPKKTGQTKAHPRGTDTSLADFFLDKVTIPGTNLSFWDIAENRDSQSFLQENIDTIMPMLCPSLSPYPDSDTPLLSTRLLHLIQTDPAIASKYLLGVNTILNFFGLKISSAGFITTRKDWQACAAYVREHQKQWQLYQLIRSLLACGFYDTGSNLGKVLLDLDAIEEYGLSEQELKNAIGGRKQTPAPLNSRIAAYLPSWCWKAPSKPEYALEDGIAFDRTLPPKRWVSYQTLSWGGDPVYSRFANGSPPLLMRKIKQGRWYWHLPHLQAPFNNIKKEPKNIEGRD